MPINDYQRGQATVIGESLERLLEVGTVSQRESLMGAMCASLKEAYENTIWTDYIVNIDIPGGPGKSPSQRGHEDPRSPGDVIEEEYEKINVVVRPQVDTGKMELLNKALRWGCEWAQKELLRLGGKLPKD